MAQYWMPPSGKPASIAPSLVNYKRGVGTDTTALSPVSTRSDKGEPPYPYDTHAEPGNPTVIPAGLLESYHFTFLIRHPRSSIPSYYRCTVPPLNEMTGFYDFRPDEAGYEELRHLFDYLRSSGQIGPKFAGKTDNKSEQTNGHTNGETNGHTNGATNGHTNGHTNGTSSPGVEICVIDADDLLDNPTEMIKAYCATTGIEWDPKMLIWDSDEDQRVAQELFAKWRGFHEDALDSDRLKARSHKKAPKSDEQLFAEWTEKFGEEGAKVIRDTVAENVGHYEYLKQFCMKV